VIEILLFPVSPRLQEIGCSLPFSYVYSVDGVLSFSPTRSPGLLLFISSRLNTASSWTSSSFCFPPPKGFCFPAFLRFRSPGSPCFDLKRSPLFRRSAPGTPPPPSRSTLKFPFYAFSQRSDLLFFSQTRKTDRVFLLVLDWFFLFSSLLPIFLPLKYDV